MQDITIYEIAEKAGVSPATVSRVINNYPFVKESTRKKVLEILENSNYQPNETARSLVNQSTKLVGILISDVRTTQHTDGVHYAAQEFSRHGYTCLICDTGSDPDQQLRAIQTISHRKVEAAVFMGSVFQNTTVLNGIKSFLSKVPVALCNGYLDGENIYGVVSDEFGGVRRCVEFLAEKGRKNIAYITNALTPSNLLKKQGYEAAVMETGRAGKTQTGPGLVIEISGSPESVKEAVLDLMEKHPETDGIIFSEDFFALAGLSALSAAGVRVPQQVSVIGINNSKYAEAATPPLTSLDNSIYDTTSIAVNNLISVLSGKEVEKKTLLETVLVERQTT